MQISLTEAQSLYGLITHFPIWFVALVVTATLWKKGFSLVFSTAGSSLRIECKKHSSPSPGSSVLESGDRKQLTPKQ
jgi:hypothetical protein